MGMRVPDCIAMRNDLGVAYLKRYYSVRLVPDAVRSSPWYSGAYFDRWPDDPEDRSPNTFTAEDLLALSYLSVPPKAEVALTVLRWRATELSDLLEKVGPDRDLADEPAGVIDNEWPAWKLETTLRSIHGIGPVTASKLIARKRPRLYPIYDNVINKVVQTNNRILQPLHQKLTMDPQLPKKLQQMREAAGLPDTISLLRVFDVLAWMEGKATGG